MPSQKHDYNAVRQSIKKVIPQSGYDDGSAGPVFVRLAWHASGSWAPALIPGGPTSGPVVGTGGSNGAGIKLCPLEAADPANAGLSNAVAFLESVKQEHPWISYSDLFTLAGVVAIKEMGGPECPWQPGRTDFEEEVHEYRDDVTGRLPDGALGADHVRDVFGRLGFNDQETVALIGAHNLGRCHADRSGFDGPWVTTPTRFSNMYFRLLLQRDWTERKWDGPRQFETKVAGQDLMMLPADMALKTDPEFRKWVEIYAKDRDRFYKDFAAAFGKLIELGVHRDESGNAVLTKRLSSGAGGGGCPFAGKPGAKKEDCPVAGGKSKAKL